jgi:hypothetical protein
VTDPRFRQIKIFDIAVLPGGAAAILILTTPARPSRDCVGASSNGFRAAVYDQHRLRHCVSEPSIAVPVGSLNL